VKLEDFVNEIDSLGLPADQVLGFLTTLYAAREIPYMLEDKTRPPPYPKQALFQAPGWVVTLLQRYGLMPTGLSGTSTYGEFAIVRYYMLTEQGYELASQAYLQHLISVADKLRSLLESFPKRLVKILALSAVEPDTGESSWLAVRDGAGEDPELAFLGVTVTLHVFLARPEELLLGTRREKPDEAELKIHEPSTYDLYISRFLVNYRGRVREKALELLEHLEGLGLAVKVPAYDTKGRYIAHEHRAPPVMVEALKSYSAGADLSEAHSLFLQAELMLRALKGELTKKELLEFTRRLGVQEEEVKALLETTHAQGLTSRYNEKGAPESPAFIVLDEAGVLQEVKEALSALESMILGE